MKLLKFRFTLKTMFTNIFLNIKLLLKKGKTKNSFVFLILNYSHVVENYIFLAKMRQRDSNVFFNV